MNKVGIRTARRDIQANHKERYQASYQKYIASQFTYGSHCLIQKLCQKSKKYQFINSVPLYSILIQVSKIMMLNQLQLLFFGAIVQQMKWNVSDSSLNQYIQAVDELSPKFKRDSNAKKIELSLLLIAYTVKKYLNQQIAIFDFRIRQIFKASVKITFDKMYQDWVTKVQKYFKFSPKSMNGMFRQLNVVQKGESQEIVNYNEKVEELFKNSDEDIKYQALRQKQKIGKNKQSLKVQQNENSFNNYNNSKNKNVNSPRIQNVKKSQIMQGVPVIEDEQQIEVPLNYNRGFSGASQYSLNLNLNKKQSGLHIFSSNEFKDPIPLNKNFSQDQFGN